MHLFTLPKAELRYSPKKRDIQKPDISMLKDGQRVAFDGIKEYLTDKEAIGSCYLEGPAGTGKSYLVAKLVEDVLAGEMKAGKSFKIAVTATTNKAVKVTYRMADYYHSSIDYKTVHSLLGLKESIGTDGQQLFIQDYKSPPTLGEYDFVLIDEISMLSMELYVGHSKLKGIQDYIDEGLKVVMVGDSCFAKGTKIIMYDGSIKKVEDIVEGDEVMGDDSTKRTVTMLCSGNASLYKVEQSAGVPYVVTGNHKVVLRRAQKEKHYSLPDEIVLTAKELMEKGDTFLEHYKGFRRQVEYAEAEQPLHPYFVGFWLGDGETCGVRLSTADYEVIDWVEQYGKTLGLAFSARPEGKNKVCWRVSLTNHKSGSNPLRRALKSLGLHMGKRVPACYQIASREQRLQLLAGLLDSDGTLHKEGRRFVFGNCDRVLMDGVLRLCSGLGFKCALTYKKREIGQPIYTLRISGSIWEIPTKIERKKYTKVGYNKNADLSKLKVTLLPEIGEYYGFELDGNHKFLLADGTVAHNCQIPPVNAKQCPALSEEGRETYNIKHFVLDEIVRQAADNPIITLATKVRKHLHIPKSFAGSEDMLWDGDKGVYFIDQSDDNGLDDLEEILSHVFTSENFRQDPDFGKIIAYHRKAVYIMNNYVRQLIYGDEADSSRLLVGEKLIVDTPVMEPGDKKIMLPTNEELEVVEFTDKFEDVNDGQFRIPYHNTKVRYFRFDNSIVEKTIKIPTWDGQEMVDDILKQLAEFARAMKGDKVASGRAWREFYDFKETFAEVSYNYAITAHRSQGSTYINCFVLEYNIDKNPRIKERQRIKYTAFTRPSQRLFVIN